VEIIAPFLGTGTGVDRHGSLSGSPGGRAAGHGFRARGIRNDTNAADRVPLVHALGADVIMTIGLGGFKVFEEDLRFL
jgi:hypothetical protein